MINNVNKIKTMQKTASTEYSVRILTQLEFAGQISLAYDDKYDNLIEKAVDFTYDKYVSDGALTKATVVEAEAMLKDLWQPAKAYKVMCIGHAHIDMNWQWRFDETVSITLATFRTMLDLMKEYPSFTFGQSQASVYKIVEEYKPEMLEEIKMRVKEGRWEIPACQWVEPDNNMPSGESHCRHLLYTKRYLSELFNLPMSYFDICFMPDTFGHHINTAEILSDGDVKYMYHCRGVEGQTFYRYQAPSGKSVLAYCEPRWYNDVVDVHNYFYVPSFCKKWGLNTVLSVFGTGDHGGGATRRDLERFKQMNEWPVMPTFEYGTYHKYFSYIESTLKNLPIVDREANFIFNGCYSSQARLKEANRVAEQALNEAEGYAARAALEGVYSYNTGAFEKSWQRTLFNQFHDILPGSGTIDTREYGRGLFQESLAYASTEQTTALSAVADAIDTSEFAENLGDISHTDAEGAGNGFGYGTFNFAVPNKAAGNKRVFAVFNPSAHKRCEVVTLTVWDWQVDIGKVYAADENENRLKTQTYDTAPQFYWGHTYFRIFAELEVPAAGYTTIVLSEDTSALTDYSSSIPSIGGPRVFPEASFVLENSFIAAEFEPGTMKLVSLVDKQSGKELVGGGAEFLHISEEPNPMSSWVVGSHTKIESAMQNVKMLEFCKGELQQRLTFTAAFGASGMRVTVSLNKNSKMLCYRCDCDFRELGDPATVTPQFAFNIPLKNKCDSFLYDVPFGTVSRKPMDYDVPALSFAYADGLMVSSKTTYAYVCKENSVSLTLIRNSTIPDRLPDAGEHAIEFSVGVANGSEKELVSTAFDYNHQITAVPAKVGGGTLAKSSALIREISENLFVYGIKAPENGDNAIILRVAELCGKDSKAFIELSKAPKEAYLADLSENKTEPLVIEGGKVVLDAKKYSLYSVIVKY